MNTNYTNNLRKKYLAGELTEAQYKKLLAEDKKDKPGTTYSSLAGRVHKISPGYVPSDVSGQKRAGW